MPPKKPAQPVGGDIDWFVIPIERIRQAAVLAVIIVVGVGAGYFLYTRTRRSPEEKARSEIASAVKPLGRASSSPTSARPGSAIAQARDLLRTAQESFEKKNFVESYRLAVESESSSRRAVSASGTEESGDASFIFVEGDVSVQTAGRSTFEPARQREALYDGDFIKTGRTGSAEIMFSDGTLYTVRPGSLFEVRRPASSTTGSLGKMGWGGAGGYTRG